MKKISLLLTLLVVIFLFSSSAALFAQTPMPDVVAKIIRCPNTVYPGQELGTFIIVQIENIGNVVATNIGVDIILSSDAIVPPVTAVFKANWEEDVLLKGGREFEASLKPGEKKIVKLNGTNTIPADTPLGNYYIGVFVDSTNTNTEISESNNTAVCPIRIKSVTGDNSGGTPTLMPDVVARILRCPSIGAAGQELGTSIVVEIANVGSADASNIGIDLILSKDANVPLATAVFKANWEEDVLLKGGREFEALLKPGEKKLVKLNGSNTIPADTPLGSYYIGVFADSTFTNSESNERNNTAVCPIRINKTSDNSIATPIPVRPILRKMRPDLDVLTVSTKSKKVDDGTRIDLQCQFKNKGADLVGSWRVSYQVNGSEVYTQAWGDIPADGIRNPAGWWIAKAPGTFKFTCVLDPDDTIKESNEGNNNKSIPFRVDPY